MSTVHINEGASLDFSLCIFFFRRVYLRSQTHARSVIALSWLKTLFITAETRLNEFLTVEGFHVENTTRKVYDIMLVVCKILLFALFRETVMTGNFVILYTFDSSIDHAVWTIVTRTLSCSVLPPRFEITTFYGLRWVHKPALVSGEHNYMDKKKKNGFKNLYQQIRFVFYSMYQISNEKYIFNYTYVT